MQAFKKWAAEKRLSSIQPIDVNDNVVVKFDATSKTTSFKLILKNNSLRNIRIRSIKITGSDTVNLANDTNNGREIASIGELFVVFDVKHRSDKISETATINIHFKLHTVIQRNVLIIYNHSAYVREHANKIRRSFYDPPKELLDVMSLVEAFDERMESLDAFIPSSTELNYKNYGNYFHGLLHLEEISLLRSYGIYNKRKAFFKPVDKNQNNFFLNMDNIFETRPSLSVGDYVGAYKNCEKNLTIYEGSIIELQEDRILIRFSDLFKQSFNFEFHQSYTVQFFFNRSAFFHKHRAIDLALKMFDSEFLFPNRIIEAHHNQLDTILDDEFNLRFCGSKNVIPWFNSKLNEYQKVAVNQILLAKCPTMPFIIYGPPGTGKTTTLTEAILQLRKLIPSSRILITAQSNSAANLLAQRLIDSGNLDKSELLRLTSTYYARSDKMPADLNDFSATLYLQNSDDNDQYAGGNLKQKIKIVNDIEYIKKFRLIVGTTCSISVLAESSKLDSSFTHVFIDEAGQCTEIDALIPMLLVGKGGQTIMAGDPMQMSPIIFDEFARARGLTTSMLSRLLDNYSRLKIEESEGSDCIDERLVIKLLLNYRSLPCILDFVNKTFYNLDLRSRVSPIDSREARTLRFLMDSNIIPSNQFRHGIYFFDTNGINIKLGTVSWCNLDELDKVVKITKKLLAACFNAADIGIISPYQLQTRYLKNYIKGIGGDDILIGTVEEFQGQERLIIIMSTVRSCSTNAKLDVKRRLGFVKCPKRLNVAASRARALFIVIGKARLLETDANWKVLIDDCRLQGTFIEESNSIRMQEKTIFD